MLKENPNLKGVPLIRDIFPLIHRIFPLSMVKMVNGGITWK
jgi:hypothetical protein